jgi:type I restriction enzyme, S subunit
VSKSLNMTPLHELCDPERGITYGIVKVGEFVQNGIRVIRGGDIRDGRVVFDAAKCVSAEVSNQFRRTILRGGEIVINLISEPGHTAIVPPELAGANVSRDVAVIALLDTVDHRYVDYALKSPYAKTWLTSRLQGSVTSKINLGTLRELPVRTPPLPEQRAIARILGALDDKIELNRKTNETLEAMARALFQSWFVDFDPVRAKMEGRQPAGMDAETARLFPDGFAPEGSPLGWKFSSLDTVADFLNGLALQKYPALGEEYLPVIKIADLRRGDTSGSDRASANIPPEYVIKDGDLLFSWSGSLEVLTWCGGRGALNQHLFKVTSSQVPRWFIHRALLVHLPEFRAIAADKATTMGHIKRGHLTSAQVALPPGAVLDRASRTFGPIEARWVKNQLETRTLTALRDTLLPKLLSGELRVPEAERAVSEVL